MALQPIKHKEPASGRKANNTVAMRSAGERLLPAVNAMDLSISFMDTGKVIMIIDPKNVKERRRILRRLVRKAKQGELTKAKVDECYYAWRNHASKGNSFKLLQRMDKYYKSLWR